MDTEPLLHQAIIENDQKILDTLDKKDPRIDQANDLGFSVMDLAFLLGRENWLQVIIPQYFERKIFVREPHAQQTKMLSLKEFEEIFDVHYLSHLIFANYARLKDVRAHCPWILKSRWGEENRQAAEMYRKEIAIGFVAPVEIRWVSPRIGYGLFARERISSGAFVGEYTGLVHRLKRGMFEANEYCLHYPTKWWSMKYFAIDALTAGNETRFINHSDRPNLQPICALDRNLLHFIFLANQEIEAGTELTVNYGPDFWRHREMGFTTEGTEPQRK